MTKFDNDRRFLFALRSGVSKNDLACVCLHHEKVFWKNMKRSKEVVQIHLVLIKRKLKVKTHVNEFKSVLLRQFLYSMNFNILVYFFGELS